MDVVHSMRRACGVAVLAVLLSSAGAIVRAQVISAVEVSINGVPATITEKSAGTLYSFSLLAKDFPVSLKNKLTWRTKCASSADGVSGVIRRSVKDGVARIAMSGFWADAPLEISFDPKLAPVANPICDVNITFKVTLSAAVAADVTYSSLLSDLNEMGTVTVALKPGAAAKLKAPLIFDGSFNGAALAGPTAPPLSTNADSGKTAMFTAAAATAKVKTIMGVLTLTFNNDPKDKGYTAAGSSVSAQATIILQK